MTNRQKLNSMNLYDLLVQISESSPKVRYGDAFDWIEYPVSCVLKAFNTEKACEYDEFECYKATNCKRCIQEWLNEESK